MNEIQKYKKPALVIPRCEIMPTGLVIDDSITFDEWKEVGRFLDRLEGSIQWMRGDWLLKAAGKWEQGKVKTIVDEMGWNFATATNLRYICDTFEFSRRRENLTFAHHGEVASLYPDVQNYWLDLAEENNWPRKELRRQIRESKIERSCDGQIINGIIYQSDYMEFLKKIADGTVDLLLTDPPYMTDINDIHSFVQWVNDVIPKIKKTGRGYIFTGAYPKEIKAYLDIILSNKEGFVLDNILVWTYKNTMGPSPKIGYKLNWQAVFHFYGPEAKPLVCPRLIEKFTVQEISQPFSTKERARFHAWEKPLELAEMFIRHSTEKDQFIIDPFAGTGAFIYQAVKMGRIAWGCDINPKMIKICKRRGLKIE